MKFADLFPAQLKGVKLCEEFLIRNRDNTYCEIRKFKYF